LKISAAQQPRERCLMSALGQKQTFGRFIAMSAIPPKADIDPSAFDARFVPKADIRALAASKVGSNRGSIEVGDLEESEPQADFAGELIFEWFKLEFSIREGTCGGCGHGSAFRFTRPDC
jgi:hypothetical protein